MSFSTGFLALVVALGLSVLVLSETPVFAQAGIGTNNSGAPTPSRETPATSAGQIQARSTVPAVSKPPLSGKDASADIVRANPWVVNGVLILLGLATLAFVVGLLLVLRKDSPTEIETHWGGYGGGLGGWRVSPALVLLIAALAFGGMLCMALVGVAGTSAKTPSQSSGAETKLKFLRVLGGKWL
jgi:hypothetical protein